MNHRLTNMTVADAPLAAMRRLLQSGWERSIHGILLACGLLSILITVGIVVVLLAGAIQFFVALWQHPHHSPWEFFTDSRWTPSFRNQHFGIRPLLCGTLLVTLGSAAIAIPLGLGTAVYLSEYAQPRFRGWVRPLLNLLAGVPSIVFGYLAIVFVSPLIRWAFPQAEVFNAASASIVLAMMVLPVIIALSEEALRAVPASLRDTAYALGGSKLDVTLRVTLPAARAGIFAAFLLAISRAIGETMAVTMAAGLQPRITFNLLRGIETMTAEIVKITSSDTPKDSLAYNTIFAIGLTLFACTLAMNVLSQRLLNRARAHFE